MTGQANQSLLKQFRTFRATMNEDAYQFEEKQRRFHEEVHRWLDKVILDLVRTVFAGLAPCQQCQMRFVVG